MSSGSILVTGGAGYIGSHAVLALRDAGRDVVVLDDLSTGSLMAIPAGVTFIKGAVSDETLVPAILHEHRVTGVMHFAGSISAPESVADPLKYYSNNTAASLAMAVHCVSAGTPSFIFSSSAAVYGAPKISPVPESAATRPANPYGASKLMTETMLLDIAVAHPSFRPLCLRYFNVAGADPQARAGQRNPDASGLIPLALAAARGRRAALDICGADYGTRDGTGERDYIHVADLAAAHVAALAYLEGGGAPMVLNCGYGRGATVLEVVAALGHILGCPVPTRPAPRRAGDVASCISDITALRATLDWRPRFDDLNEILRSAIAWEQGSK